MKKRRTDMSLAEVALSSAQHGALEVENVRMFLCELAHSRLFIKVFALRIFALLLMSCSVPYPCCKPCVYMPVR